MPDIIQWSLETSLEDLECADDLALLSSSIQDMRDKAQALDEQSAKIGPNISAVMSIGAPQTG